MAWTIGPAWGCSAAIWYFGAYFGVREFRGAETAMTGGAGRKSNRLSGKLDPLVDFEDASRLDDGRLLLALGKPLGALAVDINAGEFFAVVIVDGDLPVAMPAPTILVEAAGLPLPLRFLFHDSITLEKWSDYRKFAGQAQVPT
jgi:hypothetical protein